VTRADPDSGPAGLLAELTWRGMFHAATPGLAARLATGRPISGYNGFDPSGPSLHVGNLVPIFGLLHLQRHGGRPVALVGGATGMIGDPSGTSAERNLLDRDILEANVAGIRAQLERFIDFTPGVGALLVNNLDWLGGMSMLEFLRDVGKHFTVPYMLAKDSVKDRLGAGLSYTEFSYMLLQAADFRHLYRTYGVELQTGGADQWGNITAGLELIRRSEGTGAEAEDPVHALAFPLLLDASGAKFGKTAAGTSVWLDPDRTTAYAFFQYWIDRPDEEVGRLLRFFTLLRREEVDELEAEQAERPEARPAQRVLARDLTARVHGATIAGRVEDLSAAVFGGRLATVSPEDLEFATSQLPTVRLAPAAVAGISAAAFAVAAGAAASLGDARRTIRQGGLSLNDARLTDPEAAVSLTGGTVAVLRRGKRDYSLVDLRGE
jgi:tyrosyl-tRNA synthetase